MLHINYKKLMIIFVITVIIDSIWLFTYGKYMYLPMIKNIQGSDVKLKYIPTILTYILIALAIYFFCINNNYMHNFLLGVIIYGIFDMTNLAIFTNYTYINAFLDIIWGGILFTSVCHVTNKIKK